MKIFTNFPYAKTELEIHPIDPDLLSVTVSHDLSGEKLTAHVHTLQFSEKIMGILIETGAVISVDNSCTELLMQLFNLLHSSTARTDHAVRYQALNIVAKALNLEPNAEQ